MRLMCDTMRCTTSACQVGVLNSLFSHFLIAALFSAAIVLTTDDYDKIPLPCRPLLSAKLNS